MAYPSLKEFIEKLKASPRVKGIFSTGTTATKMNPPSDIDLIVVLDKNTEDIKSVYTTIEGRFSDIFFFDIDFLNQLKNKKGVSGNKFEGMFLDWLKNGKIEYDPKNLLADLKNKIEKVPPVQKVADSEKKRFLDKSKLQLYCQLSVLPFQ